MMYTLLRQLYFLNLLLVCISTISKISNNMKIIELSNTAESEKVGQEKAL